LAISLTGGNRNDVTQLVPLLDALHARPVRGKRGRPRRKPDRLPADRGYDHDKYRRLLRIRYERRLEIHTAFLLLACAILCWRRLKLL
jgi:hypothetical protein